MRYFSIFLLVLSLYLMVRSVVHEGAQSAGHVPREVPIWTLPEMDEIPQTRNWPPDHTPLTLEENDAFQRCWEPLYPRVAEKVTPGFVWELSRFGKDSMEYYARPPAVYRAEYVTWEPVARETEQKRVLMSAVLERLPAPYPIRRELRAFCLFSTESQSIEWVLLTIQLSH